MISLTEAIDRIALGCARPNGNRDPPPLIELRIDQRRPRIIPDGETHRDRVLGPTKLHSLCLDMNFESFG